MTHMLEPTLRTPGLDTAGKHLRRGAAPGAGPEALPDLLLMERARSGDERALEALIRRYSRRLFRVARSVLMDDERAEAAVLESLVAAFAGLGRYESTGKFAAWLTRLVYNQARTVRPGARAVAAPAAASAGAADPAGAAAADSGSGELRERRELEQAIASLPAVFRTVYVLRVVEGVSGIETAASLGIHETTVRTRLYRAHRRLGPETAQRIRVATAVLELPPHSVERIVSRALAQRPHASMVAISASPP
jgi:RNA polymerase sigma-70 factor, ECF subfamily